MKYYKILVTGANGQLGSEIRSISNDYKEFEIFFTTKQELDICDKQAVEDYLLLNNINSIVNCAAYTAVDKAESETELADKINYLAVKGLAEISKKYNIRLIHISTDYVFDGESEIPYVEADLPNPQTVYGKSKLAGENAMRAVNPQSSIIIRTSWVYSHFGNNFVKTMLRLARDRDEIKVVSDQVGSPTNAADLATAILKILPKLKNEVVEVLHYSNEGVCSWYEFAKTVFEIKSLKIKVNPIETLQYPTSAKRPYYSLMNKSMVKEKYQLEIPYWKDSLFRCLKIMVNK